MVKQILYPIIFLLVIGIAAADAEDFAEAKKLIEAKTSCDKLSEGQLEEIGDYLMEQIHPGQAHELMDKMMGGEESESLRLMHVAMAKRLYCNDFSGMTNYGMMAMMGVGFNKNTNYGGMMNMMGTGFGTNMMGYGSGYGMMGSYGYWSFINFLSLVLVIGLIILVYLWVFKLWKEASKKSK